MFRPVLAIIRLSRELKGMTHFQDLSTIVFVLLHGEGRKIKQLGEKICLLQGCYWRNIVAGGSTVVDGLPTEQPMSDRFQLLKRPFRYQLSFFGD